jgi:hypothetical protein
LNVGIHRPKASGNVSFILKDLAFWRSGAPPDSNRLLTYGAQGRLLVTFFATGKLPTVMAPVAILDARRFAVGFVALLAFDLALACGVGIQQVIKIHRPLMRVDHNAPDGIVLGPGGKGLVAIVLVTSHTPCHIEPPFA